MVADVVVVVVVVMGGRGGFSAVECSRVEWARMRMMLLIRLARWRNMALHYSQEHEQIVDRYGV